MKGGCPCSNLHKAEKGWRFTRASRTVTVMVSILCALVSMCRTRRAEVMDPEDQGWDRDLHNITAFPEVGVSYATAGYGIFADLQGGIARGNGPQRKPQLDRERHRCHQLHQ